MLVEIFASDDVPVRRFPAVDSADNLLKLAEGKSSKRRKGDAPPRQKRGNEAFTPTESTAAYEPSENSEEDEKLDLEAGGGHNGEHRRRRSEDDNEEELEDIDNRNSKSVRWSDHTDGGALSEVRVALSYNRKELSYQPKSRIKFGIWSPMQKKIFIGVGIVIVIILIVLFSVVFAVVKPSNKSPTPPPKATPTAPFSRGPLPPFTSPIAPPA